MTDRTGQQIDYYRLMLLLGQGTFGEVYLAEHLHNHRRVAVKILTTPFAPKILEDFLHETRTLFLLNHPHIVPPLDFGLENKIPFLVFAYASNGTLSQRHHSGVRVPLDVINIYIQQIASALQYAHEKRLIHRDVKPQNMLLDQQGQVLVSDFGIAAVAHSEGSLKTENMTGTIPYMAPEQLQGKPRPASDQYALAVCAYEWLCGTRPFTGSTWELIGQHLSAEPPALRSHVPELPAAVEEVVLRALAKDPQQRFATIFDFAIAFKQASQLFPPTLPDKGTAWSKRPQTCFYLTSARATSRPCRKQRLLSLAPMLPFYLFHLSDLLPLFNQHLRFLYLPSQLPKVTTLRRPPLSKPIS